MHSVRVPINVRRYSNRDVIVRRRSDAKGQFPAKCVTVKVIDSSFLSGRAARRTQAGLECGEPFGLLSWAAIPWC
jgi:hypothetical protein